LRRCFAWHPPRPEKRQKGTQRDLKKRAASPFTAVGQQGPDLRQRSFCCGSRADFRSAKRGFGISIGGRHFIEGTVSHSQSSPTRLVPTRDGAARWLLQ
jgi:hypothetical protein